MPIIQTKVKASFFVVPPAILKHGEAMRPDEPRGRRPNIDGQIKSERVRRRTAGSFLARDYLFYFGKEELFLGGGLVLNPQVSKGVEGENSYPKLVPGFVPGPVSENVYSGKADKLKGIRKVKTPMDLYSWRSSPGGSEGGFGTKEWSWGDLPAWQCSKL